MRTQHFKKSALAIGIFGALQVHADEKAVSLRPVVVVDEFQQSLVDRIPIDQKELPYTLNVLDREFLDERNFSRPIEALTTLPNITRTEDRKGLGTAQFLSRGFFADVLVDNRVQNQFRGSGQRDDSFVDRYEVLKGPASISFGAIQAGGVINTITKVPQTEQFTDVELRGDHFGSLGLEVDANVGELVPDKVLFRISGAYRDFEFDADETKREEFAIRPVVRVNFSEATTAKASIAYTRKDIRPNSGFPLLANGDIPPEIDTDTFTGYANGDGENEDLLYEAELQHKFLDNLKLTLRGSRQETDFDYQNLSSLYDYSNAGINAYAYAQAAETEQEATFFDAQLAYEAVFWDQPQDFVVGVAYDERSFDRLFSSYVTEGPFPLSTIDQPRFGPTEFGPLTPFTLTNQELHSVYAEAALRPNDWLTLIGGVRHDSLDQETTNIRGPNTFVSTYDDEEVTYRLGATASVTNNLNVYASFAQAFAPQFGVQRNAGAVPAETSDGYEIGVKGAAFNGKLTFEAAWFHTIRKDVAVPDPNNTPTETFVVTVGELEVTGIELTGNLNPVPGLNLTASLGTTDIDVIDSGGGAVTEPVFPGVTGSAYGSYVLQSGTLSGLKLGGGFRHVGERNGPIADFESYTIVDLNFSYPIMKNTTVHLDVLNVSDERYVESSAGFAQRLNGGAVLGPPRTAVLTVRSRF